MDDSADIADNSRPAQPQRFGFEPPRFRLGLAVVSRAMCLSVAMASVFFLIRLFTIRQEVQIYWMLQVSMGLAALLSSVFVAVHQWHHWAVPLQQLMAILPRVRSGDLPIEELRKIGGGLSPLVTQIQETIRDTRRQRARVVLIEKEMRQRLEQQLQAAERRLGSMQAKAARDALTGIYNRRMLDECLPSVLRECQAQGTPLCVMMIDVDFFKRLNDTLGHAAGDTLLKSIGQLIRSTIRQEDWAFRYGGDEFVLVLPGTSREGGEILGRRLASLVDGLVKPMRLPSPPRLSFGLATLDDVYAGAEASVLLQCADHELYRLKTDRKQRERRARQESDHSTERAA